MDPKEQIVGGFWSYINYAEAAVDYARTLQREYPTAFVYKNDGMKFATQLRHYATDPLYVQKLQSIIKRRNLTQYDAQP